MDKFLIILLSNPMANCWLFKELNLLKLVVNF